MSGLPYGACALPFDALRFNPALSCSLNRRIIQLMLGPPAWRRNEIGRGFAESSHPRCRRTEDNGAPKKCSTRCRSPDQCTFHIPGTRCNAHSRAECTVLLVPPLSWIASCSWELPRSGFVDGDEMLMP